MPGQLSAVYRSLCFLNDFLIMSFAFTLDCESEAANDNRSIHLRKRIWRMSEDRFDEELPQVEFDREKIEVHTPLNDDTEGTFNILSVNGISMRGVVYSSNPYVFVENPGFEGEKAEIRFRSDTHNFTANDRLDGEFTAVVQGNEVSIPFTIIIDETYPRTSTGEIRSLAEFTELYHNYPQEAVSLFWSSKFADLMKKQDDWIYLLYKGFSSGQPSVFNLENFLVAAGEKEAVSLHFFSQQTKFYDVVENQKQAFHLTKNGWGAFHLKVKCDADFITFETYDITPDFFLGQSMELSYYIHANRLHAGINQCIVNIDGNNFHVSQTLLISTFDEGAHPYEKALKKQKRTADLVRSYIDFRLQKKTMGEWADEVIRSMDELLLDEPAEYFYQLYKTQALIVSGRRQEALWIITDLKRQIKDKVSFEWAYLLYLCSLIEPEESYIDRITDEIEKIFQHHPEDMRIFWFLLFLRREYLTDTRRKQNAIMQWIRSGISSPILYIEGFDLMCQDPYLIRSFDDYTVRILTFGLRHDALNKNILMQIPDILRQEKDFSPQVFRLVTKCYEINPDDDLLQEIAAYLIRGKQIGSRYAVWYKTAIYRELKLNGLYEAYIYSVDDSDMSQLPKLLVMYFNFENALSAQKKAFLYANVILYKDSWPKIFEEYRHQIEDFSLEMMRGRRIDDNLAIIYQEVLNEGLIDSDVANVFGDLFFYNKIVCTKRKSGRVFAFSRKAASPQIVPLVNSTAYVSCPDKDTLLILETEDGLYTDDDLFIKERLITGDEIYDKLKGRALNTYPYFLHELDDRKKPSDFSAEDAEDIRIFIEDRNIDDYYRASRYQLMYQALKYLGREELLAEDLMNADILTLTYSLRNSTVEQLILAGRSNEAYEKIRTIDGMQVPMNLMLRLISEQISLNNGGTDDFLVQMSAFLMDHFLTSEETVRYLNDHYTGPTLKMSQVFRYASARQLVTHDLEERLLTQMLYTGNIPDNVDEIFASYRKGIMNRMLVEALLSYFSHEYIVHDKPLSNNMYQYLLFLKIKNNSLNDSCRVALLKRLCMNGNNLSEREFDTLDVLMRESMIRNQYFSFYRKADERIIIRYHLYDKLFAEYHGRPGMSLIIRKKGPEGAKDRRDMIEMYDGIYVRDFVLFYGDTINYEIVTSDDGEVLTEGTLSLMDNVMNEEMSRYGFINQLESSIMYQDSRHLTEDMKHFNQLDVLTDRLFQIV